MDACPALADFRILLVTLVGFPQLLQPAFQPALLTAVSLTPIARPADEKHQTATDRPAKSLSKRNFRRHGSRGGVDNDGVSWQAELHCLKVRLPSRSHHNKTPTVDRGRGFSFLRH